ncbi:MAG TPA: hypothetical protein VGL89_18255 [Candidatus Koribacter sp.]|jgi:hypothetical protein
MNFEVKGQNYVLTFLPNEGSFALFERDGEDFERMKIVHDDGPMFIAQIEPEADAENKPKVN